MLRVDDSEEHWIVRVPEGISAGVERDSFGSPVVRLRRANNSLKLAGPFSAGPSGRHGWLDDYEKRVPFRQLL